MRRLMRQFGPPVGAFGVNHDSPQAAGLVAWWPALASRGGGEAWRDLVSGFDLPFVNGGSWISTGVGGIARKFTAASTQYALNTVVPVRAMPVTLAAWYRFDPGAAANNELVQVTNSGGGQYYSLRAGINAGGDTHTVVQRAIQSGIGAPQTVASDGVLYEWRLAVAVFLSGSSRLLYVDGKLAATSTDACTPQSGEFDRTYIGGSMTEGTGFRFPFDGEIGEVRIYNRALTADDVYHMFDPATRWDLYRTAQRVGVSYAGAITPTSSRRQAIRWFH